VGGAKCAQGLGLKKLHIVVPAGIVVLGQPEQREEERHEQKDGDGVVVL
jgi:hypothetical protein